MSESLDRHFKGCKNRIIVTTFASNMHRIQAVFNIAHCHGRKVAVTGRSMENILRSQRSWITSISPEKHACRPEPDQIDPEGQARHRLDRLAG